MFYERHIICHLIDRCTRWHEAQEVPDRSMASLISMIQETWVGRHGEMTELIVDGEKAVQSWQADAYFDHKSIKCEIK